MNLHRDKRIKGKTIQRILYLMGVLFYLGRASAAQLGFQAPLEVVLPGQLFNVNAIAHFEPYEPSTWNSGSRPELTMLGYWPGGIRVVSCAWNTVTWDFTTRGWCESDTGSFFWARARALSAASLTGTVVIGTLTCVATEVDDETFYYDTDPDAEPFPTTLTIRHNGALIDILGDPDDDEDGVDEVSVTVSDTPGYTLRVQPEAAAVPLTYGTTPVRVEIEPVGPAAPYEHVRAHLTFDDDVFHMLGVDSICTSLPAFVTRAEIHCSAETAVPADTRGISVFTNDDSGSVIVELWCEPTNYAGALFSVELQPQSLAEESEIELRCDDMELPTVVERFDVDLLGTTDDPEDGVENAYVSVRYVDGMRLLLEPIAPVGLPGSVCTARVMLVKCVTTPVQFDMVDLEVFFDPALLACATDAFAVDAAVTAALTRSVVTITNGTFRANPGRADALWYPWTTAALRVQLDWLNSPLVMTRQQLCLGELRFVPQTTGVVGFVRGDMAVTHGVDDLQDEAACSLSWPMTMSIINGGPPPRTVMIELERGDGDGSATVLRLGDEAAVNVVAHGAPLVNAAYDLRWVCDDTRLALRASAGVTSMQVVVQGVTSTALRVSGIASTLATTTLATVHFTAVRPGTVVLSPITYVMAPDAFSTMSEEGVDVLGVAGVPGDGVGGMALAIAAPQRVGLVLEPEQTLFAGVESAVRLSVANAHAERWDALDARLLFDANELLVLTDGWRMQGQGLAVTACTQRVRLVSTNELAPFYDADLSLRTLTTTNSAIAATLPVMPLCETPYWMFATDPDAAQVPASNVRFGPNVLTDTRGLGIIDENKWRVYAPGAVVWIGDNAAPPVLGSNYTITVRVDNPHGVAIQRVSFAYSFDATVMEIADPVVLDNVSTNGGGVWISNSSDGGYVCGELYCSAVTTNRSLALLQLTVKPKLNEPVELVPESIYFDDDRVVGMGVWNALDINVMSLLDNYPEDLCPVWRRGVAWFDVPQLYVEDIYLPAFGCEVVCLDDILVNQKPNRMYKWWVAGVQNHVSITISPLTRTLTATSLDDWSGTASFRLYCQELGSPYVGESCLNVVVDGEEPCSGLDIQMKRTDYYLVREAMNDDVRFTVQNATGVVAVTAEVVDRAGRRTALQVRDETSGLIGSALDIRGAGAVLWPTRAFAPGRYQGRICVNSAGSSEVVSAVFYADVFDPGLDDDGDVYFLLYRSPAGRRVFTGRSVQISNGTEKDTLTMKVKRGPNGDGLVTMDSIQSDSGFKRIALKGAIQTIDLNGPLGALSIAGGSVDSINVTHGAIGTIRIQNKWLASDQSFVETVGIVREVVAAGAISTICVDGGAIGTPDEPALIRSQHGAIGTVMTRLAKRGLRGDGFSETVVSSCDGANICANIEALGGGIGKVQSDGGSIGAPEDYPACTLTAAGGIRLVRATAMVYDGEALGGAVFANLVAGGAVGTVQSIGGDISYSSVTDPEDLEEVEHLPLRITAQHVRALSSKAKVYRYDGARAAFGGSIHAMLALQQGLDKLSAVGGNVRVCMSSACGPATTKRVRVQCLRFKEYADDVEPIVRGGELVDSILATAHPNAFKSMNPADYFGPVQNLQIDGAIRNSWIGFNSGIGARTLRSLSFKYGQLINSEIWEVFNGRIYVNGR